MGKVRVRELARVRGRRGEVRIFGAWAPFSFSPLPNFRDGRCFVLCKCLFFPHIVREVARFLGRGEEIVWV